MTYIHKGTPGAQRMVNYDDQAKVKSQENQQGLREIDHGASATANLKETGKNLKDMFTLNHFDDMKGGFLDFRVIFAPYLVAFEIADVVAGPLKMAKNLGDAAMHGAMAGIAKLTGGDD